MFHTYMMLKTLDKKTTKTYLTCRRNPKNMAKLLKLYYLLLYERKTYVHNNMLCI